MDKFCAINLWGCPWRCEYFYLYMMQSSIKHVLAGILILSATALSAQQRNWDPATMAEREKTLVMDSLTDLTEDQKIVIEQIYTDFADEVKQVFASNQGNREQMRGAMMEARQTKNELLKEILTEPQMKRLTAIMEGRRRRSRNN